MLSLSQDCLAFEIITEYAVIEYPSKKVLKDFNHELYMGRFKFNIRRRGNDTIEEEVKNKIDFIIEKVMKVLNMYLPELKFRIKINQSKRGVRADFKRIYNINVNYIAFYSPSENRIFYSANNAELRVVTHEIGHVIAENYFTVSPPQNIHEVIAQYAEKHITD
jgi:ribosomal protein L23